MPTFQCIIIFIIFKRNNGFAECHQKNLVRLCCSESVSKVTICRRLTVKTASGKGDFLELCALYLLPAEPEEIIFQSYIQRTSSLMHSPLLLCVYVCLILSPSPTITFPPYPLLSSSFSRIFCFSVSYRCTIVHFFLLTWSTLRQISFYCCGPKGPIGDLLLTHNKHTDYSAAAVKLSLTFTQRQALQLWLL